MKFDDLNLRMREYEKAGEQTVLPNVYMVARIDGRSFTKLTKTTQAFEAPFDERFRDYMIKTTCHLMDCGFKVIYGYTQSDEISLLFDLRENAFGRKLNKLNSVLAGEASASFYLLLGDHACFDCRISQLPNVDLVVDYFRWRNEDAHRNSLNAWCYWTLRKNGNTPTDATHQCERLSVSEKNELLFQVARINFGTLPAWQRRGVGVYWEGFRKKAINPKTNEEVEAERRRLNIDMELPMKDAYSEFVRQLL